MKIKFFNCPEDYFIQRFNCFSEAHGIDMGGGGQQDNNQQDQNNQQTRDENNNGDNVDPFDSIWNDDAGETGNQSDTGNNNNNQQIDNNQVSPVEQLNQYVSNLNFTDGVDMNALQQDMSEGKLDKFNDAMQSVGANAYKRALIDMNQVMEKRIQAAVADAVSKSRGSVGVDMAVQQMHQELPFTKKGSVSPVAEEILGRFIKKGQSPTEAIKSVRGYFEGVAGAMGMKGNTRTNGFGQNTNRQSDNSGDDFDGENLNFMDIFTQKGDDNDD